MTRDLRTLFAYSAIFSLASAFVAGLVAYRASASLRLPAATVQTSASSDVSAPVQTATLAAVEAGVKSVAKSVSPSVVSILVSKDVPIYKTDPFGFFYQPSGTVRKQIGGGSGFFVRKDGYVLTNKHVVSDPNASYSVILSTGEELQGKVLAFDPVTDLAVVRAYVSENVPYESAQPVSFVASTSDIEVGSFVVAIGNALAQFQNTVTFGVVSGLGRSIEANDASNGSSEELSGLVQTDTAINPGNSGGPLVGLDGRVVGINTAVTQGANGIGFAIPLSERLAGHIVESVVKYGTIKRAYVGIKYAPVDAAVAASLGLSAPEGVLIGENGVVSGSPADKAGLRPGDVLLEADGKKLGPNFGIREAVAEKFPGDPIHFKVFRQGSGTFSAALELAERP